jgi:5-hydroxyisourate hydrolase-like protein (transthyretin family)
MRIGVYRFMKRLVILVAFAVSLIFCCALKAYACSCAFGGGAPCQEYWRAEAVFSGTIIGSSSIKVKEESFPRTERQVRVAITQAFRGIEGGQTEVITGLGGGDCGYGFELGKSYLIYAFRSERDGKFHTSICTRTRPIGDSDDDIAFINSLATAEPGATIFGQVAKRNYYWKEGEKWYKPVPDAEVTIEGHGEKRELKSDAEGNFRVSGFQPGSYKVLLKLPPGLLRNSYVKDEGARVVENEVSVVARGCAQSDFHLESDSRVTGRVVDPSGQPIADLRLDMRGADADNRNINVFLSTQTNQDGTFEFKVVAPGDYRLGFRILNSQSTMNVPYPRTYYPGVTSKAAARVITVKEGVRLHELEFQMPAALQEYQVEGQVVWSDGKQAPGVSIYLSLMEDGEMSEFSSLRADAEGRFKLKIFEGLQYKVSAYPDGARGPEAQSPWITLPALHGPRSVKLVLPGARQ